MKEKIANFLPVIQPREIQRVVCATIHGMGFMTRHVIGIPSFVIGIPKNVIGIISLPTVHEELCVRV